MFKAAAVCIIAALLPSLASAQFGMLNIPTEDFVWRWADAADEAPDLGREDFEVRGSEMSFYCILKGELSPGSQITTQELTQMETAIAASLSFINASATAMNDLDFNRELGWAILDCKKPEGQEEDPAEVQEKVDRARQKAIDDMLRRRERAQQP